MDSFDPLQSKTDKLLIQAEVAERVRRPVATLRYWRAMGIGPKGAKIGGRVLYRESDVEAWIDEQFAAAEVGGPDAAA
jgi:DNA-binding transcriptional MerR regulator